MTETLNVADFLTPNSFLPSTKPLIMVKEGTKLVKKPNNYVIIGWY